MGVFFPFVGLEDDVLAVGVDGEGVGKGFVEGALPPFAVGVGVPAESLRSQCVAMDAEDADLLTGKTWKGLCAEGWGEEAVVGVHRGQDVELASIEGHEGDVAEGVVFALACAAEVGDAGED